MRQIQTQKNMQGSCQYYILEFKGYLILCCASADNGLIVGGGVDCGSIPKKSPTGKIATLTLRLTTSDFSVKNKTPLGKVANPNEPKGVL